jgi:hypothetical protein
VGSQLTSMQIDLTDRRVVITAEVTDGSVERTISLTLDGVSGLHIERPDSGWDESRSPRHTSVLPHAIGSSSSSGRAERETCLLRAARNQQR